MKKIVFTFFLLLLFSNLYCGPIQIKAKGLSSAHAPRNPESIPITASINNNVLSILVGKNVGITNIIIGDSDSSYVVDENYFSTPQMINIVINNAGDYTLTIILNNGDTFYGEFVVE